MYVLRVVQITHILACVSLFSVPPTITDWKHKEEEEWI